MDEKIIQNLDEILQMDEPKKNVGEFRLCSTCALGSRIWKKMKNKKGDLAKSKSLEHLAFFGWR
jgi:hypothetical protein